MNKTLTSDPRRAGGRLVMSGFAGTSPGRTLLEAVRAGDLGGVLIRGENYESPARLGRLTAELQTSSPWPLLIAVVQELGAMRALGEPFTALPSAERFGSRHDPALAARAGKVIGRELAAVGVNLNLAPVLETAAPHHRAEERARCFGEDPKVVARLGSSFGRGLEESGVLSCAKYFPAQGTAFSLQTGAPEVGESVGELAGRLIPFAEHARRVGAAVMISNARWPDVDEERPCCFSPAAVQVLRRRIGFNGLVLSPALEATSGVFGYSVVEMAGRGLDAGLDVFHFADELEAAREAAASLRALPEGALRHRASTALRRVDAAARHFGLPRRAVSEEEASRVIGCRAHRSVAEECDI